MAVRDVSIAVEVGEIRALIGPNGAGKTTLLNLLAGTLRPSAGSVFLNEQDITRLPVYERSRLGISRSYQVVNLFSNLNCRQVLQLALQRDRSLHTWLSGDGIGNAAMQAEQALEAEGLRALADVESIRVSHGLQKRLELALALANDSQLLLLDEPMAGLSPAERLELRERLRRLARARTIVFVEHDMDMVMTLADRVTVMHDGSVVAEGTPQEVRADGLAQSVYLQANR